MTSFVFEPKLDSDYISIKKMWNDDIGVFSNIKFLVLEILFGAQITELLSDTSSIQLIKAGTISGLESSKADNGLIGKLCKFIPPSRMTKMLEKPLCEMLYTKYFLTYQFLINSENNILPSGSTRPETDPSFSDPTIFRLNKQKATELSAYRGKLNFIWTTSETLVASVTWITTNSLEITLLLTGIIEFSKRFRI